MPSLLDAAPHAAPHATPRLSPEPGSLAGGALVLDVQALQSVDHRDRGIGRWVFDFTDTLCRLHPQLLGALLLNPDLPVPAGLERWAATGKLAPADEAAVPASARIFHVLSPFELGVGLERLWPLWAARRGLRCVVTLYDLIPAVYPGRYLADAGIRRRYRARLELVRGAEAVLAISAATREDAVTILGLDPAQVTTVGTGIAATFTPPASPAQRAAALAGAQSAVAGLEPGFLLSVGGEDERKNLEGLLGAYALLPAGLRRAHQLVIACQLTDGYRRHLQTVAAGLGIAHRIVLTGQVSDVLLRALYQSTELFVLASHYEGFGLPVAEAMACGAVAIASNVSALAELVQPAGQFDPADPAAIAATMERALTDRATRAALTTAAQQPAPLWSGVVDRAVALYRRLLAGPPRGGRAGAPT